MKKRILIANDSSFLSTGYGVMGKELLTKLHNTGKYELAELGCYADHKCGYKPPWKFYPNAVPSDDPRFQQYRSDAASQFGSWRFERVLLDFKPHIVFDVRDYWMYSYQEITSLRKYFHWVIMPTVDSAPQKIEWYFTFANADIIMPYTEWARKVLTNGGGHRLNIYPKITNAGFNKEDFYPIENKEQHKIDILGDNYDVIGVVMRNQKRKLFPEIFKSYRKYLDHLLENNLVDKYNKSILYMHTTYPEESGWDMPALLLEFNLLNKVLFSYKCKNCQHYQPSKFKGGLIQCKKCKNFSCTFASVSNGVDNETLNKIYNLFDLFVQCAICEGFGMPQIEAAACGVPIASVDYSAMTEIVENLNGFKIPVAATFREMETNADRVYPDIDAMSYIYKYLFLEMKDEDRKNLSKQTRELSLNRYTWDHVFEVWDECFSSIDITKKIPWDASISPTFHENTSVSTNQSPIQTIKFISDSILNEPYIFYTAPVQQLLRDYGFGLVSRGGSVKMMPQEEAQNMMNMLLQNKLRCEEARINSNLLQKEDYL